LGVLALDAVGTLTASGPLHAKNRRFFAAVASVPARNPSSALAYLRLIIVATGVAIGATFLTEFLGVLPNGKELQVLARPGRTLVLIAIDALGRTDWGAGPLLDVIVDKIPAYSNRTKGNERTCQLRTVHFLFSLSRITNAPRPNPPPIIRAGMSRLFPCSPSVPIPTPTVVELDA
jgi:hypothetical protein